MLNHESGSVTSQDGTTIAFEKLGSGPVVILIASALADRTDAARLGRILAPYFTVINYDRRGRGASGNTLPYSVEREVEDLAALIQHVGGSAAVFGSSSGAILAADAAARDIGITKLALYEPPVVVDPGDSRPPDDVASRLAELIAADRRSEAVRYFFTRALQMPAAFVMFLRLMPRTWSKLTAMAHTVPYDLAIMASTQAGQSLPAARWTTAKAPTLVLNGGKSPAWMARGARALADALPNAEHRQLAGLSHGAVVMSPKKLAPTLIQFFKI